MGLVASWQVESSQIRDRTCVSHAGRRILHTREARYQFLSRMLYEGGNCDQRVSQPRRQSQSWAGDFTSAHTSWPLTSKPVSRRREAQSFRVSPACSPISARRRKEAGVLGVGATGTESANRGPRVVIQVKPQEMPRASVGLFCFPISSREII